MKKPIISLLAACAAFAAQAVPAYPGTVRVTQPDGSTLELTLRGDEHCHWAESADGRLMELDSATGFYTEVSEVQLRARRLAARAAAQSSFTTQVDGTFPATGKRKMLMLLVNFADTETTYTQTDFNNYMNQKGYGGIGSFRDFYLDNSYGALDITTTVSRWIKLPYPKMYYGDAQVTSLIAEALGQIAQEMDLRQFDNDGDGIMDGLAIIHQGGGQEATGNSGDIWSHSSAIYNMEIGGVQVRRYTIQPEILGTTGGMSTIGVMCHEFGHNLGAPDFYDTDYSSSGGDYPGTGQWDIMGSGAWNGTYGNRPTGINMWQKIQLGWVTPTLLEESTDVSAMPAAIAEPAAYRFDTTVPGEYFILENRQKRSGTWDQTLPGHGLIAYHVSESLIDKNIENNTLNVGYPQAIYTVCASSSYEPADHAASYGFVNSDGAPFPGANGVTEFSDRTTPSTRSINGRYSYKALSAITEGKDGTISFRFTAEEAPEAPANLAARTAKGVVTLTWDAPKAEKPVSYSVYRNGDMLTTVSKPGYVDNATAGLSAITYDVDAVYSSGLTSPCATVSLRVPINTATELTATPVAPGRVQLNWTLDSKLTRMAPDADEALQQTDYAANTLEYIHRFRVADLQTYRGQKIRRIGFLPVQSPQEISCTLRVYEADADGSNPIVVSERALKEFGAAVWNNTLLTKTVEITGEKELWIGVEVKSSIGTVRLVSDKGPAVNGYGNLIRINGGELVADTHQQGNIFCYAQLSSPAAVTELDVPDFTSAAADMELDMLLPIGFSVERDGKSIGTAGGNTFTDTDAPLTGVHTYTVSALYRGDNVSGAISTTFDTAGIDEIGADSDLPARYFDLLGREVTQPIRGAVYLRLQGSQANKIIY